jgi:hypothetical protein
MLASLLPGLRDVRTPLTVGYLWLFTAWLVFGEHVPKSRPSGNGLVAQLFDLGGLLGKVAPIAALSFIAYLLGALLTIPVESRFISRLLTKIGNYSIDTRLTTDEYNRRQIDLAVEFAEQVRLSRETKQQLEISASDARALDRLGINYQSADAHGPDDLVLTDSALYLRANDLRARLLIANQQMYGEYDRLAAEASFRVNMTLPLMALGFLIVSDFNVFLGLGIMAGAVVLLVQGAIRLNLSNTVLRRAVIADVIKDPLTEKFREILDKTSSQP